ncbi:MAG: hypothetical protein ABR543_03760 [Gemmatimonadaceae bacterium]
MANYERYLIWLAYHWEHADDLHPSQGKLKQYDATLFARYDALIRNRMRDKYGDTQLDVQQRSYIAALTASSAGHTAAARVQDACEFYDGLRPTIPGSGVLTFSAVSGHASRTGVSGSTRRTTAKSKTMVARRAKKKTAKRRRARTA